VVNKLLTGELVTVNYDIFQGLVSSILKGKGKGRQFV